jgi:hypothetical protein
MKGAEAVYLSVSFLLGMWQNCEKNLALQGLREHLLSTERLRLALVCALLVADELAHGALQRRLQPDLLVAEVAVRHRLEVRAHKVVLPRLQRPTQRMGYFITQTS